MIGSDAGAERALTAYRWYGYGAEVVGRGEDRVAYDVGEDGVIYKIGRRNSANIADHESLEEWRRAGAPWAPPSTLYLFELGDETWVVMAMPLLVDDGSEADPAAVVLMHHQAGGTVDRTNYVVINGHPIVIDGNAISTSPPPPTT